MTTKENAAVRELAAALRDALDVPIPARHVGWDVQRDLFSARTAFLRGVLGDLAERGDIGAATGSVRKVVQQYPVTYTPYTREQDGGAE